MNTNIVISLDTRSPKQGGTYPLIMRLGHQNRTTSISLNIDLHEKDWDAKKRLIKKTYTDTNSVTRLNNQNNKSKADAMDIILKLQESGELSRLSVIELKQKIIQKNKVESVFDYTDKLIKDLMSTSRIGTARSYKGTIDVLRTFNNEQDLAFDRVTYKFLNSFENHHIAKGNSYNGLSVYLRALRAIFNKAIKEGVVEKDLYPFADYKIKSVPTEKRALDGDLLKSIISLELPKNHECFNARNYFIASFLMYGMNFSDMAFLKKENMIDGRIKYRRKKTSKLYDIKITSNLKTIIDHYLKEKKEGEYIFPIIKRNTAITQDKDIQWARKRYNKKLKIIAQLCAIQQNLTSYVSRHSFATQAMLQQVPVNAISAMLGHSSIKTTEIYLKSLPSNILDDYNSSILSNL